MNDRALQALVKLAMEPEWEAKFETNSFGFRPGRTCHDAIQQIFMTLRECEQYILETDIEKCFDKINHESLLKKINTFPTLRKQIKAWLKSGVMDNGVFEETEAGCPQGGVISPLLANIALHGMENCIKEAIKYKTYQPQIIRYADDLVIISKHLVVIRMCQEALEKWLEPMGLKLKPSKTRICHSLREFEGEKPGFDFLGFNIKQYPVGKAKSAKSKGTKLGFKLLIKPSKEKIKNHLRNLKQVIKTHKSSPQKALIGKLNPIIKGWANYYSTVVSKKVYSYCDKMLWEKLRKWAKRRHPKRKVKYIKAKYWKTLEGREVFATETGYQLHLHAKTPIKRFYRVKGRKSPYDGDWVYWSSRMGKNPLVSKTVSTLLKRQKGKCPHCKGFFTTLDIMEIDHIIPKSKGGKSLLENLQLLHRHCHDNKTAMDMKTNGCTNDNGYLTEEPYEAKVSSTVLKTSGIGDSFA